MMRAMRVLFSCTAGFGHFFPLVPLARAFEEAGHEVAFATAEPSSGAAAAAGFEVLPAGLGQSEIVPLLEQHRQRLEEIPPAERRPAAFAGRFAQLEGPRKVDDLLTAARDWRPDLVVHEPADLAAPLVAASLGVRSANHGFGRLMPAACYERAEETLTELWRGHGLEPEPFGGAYRGPYVDICPPSFQTESVPAGVRTLLLGPAVHNPNGEAPPAWLDELPDRPTVYVTLGTVFNDAGVFRVLLGGLADVECNVVATVGRNVAAAALGPIPVNARVEQWIPQALVLPRCSVAVGHGGSGSTLAALAHGLPLLLVPRGADQFENAAHAEGLGVARVLMPDALSEEAVRTGVEALVADASYREQSMGLAREIEGMGTPGDVVAALEVG